MIYFLTLISLCFTHFLLAEKTHFLLVRHGETSWNVEHRFSGWTDIPLNPRGKIQAEKLARYLKAVHCDLAALYSSDLSRAFQTAEETSKILDLPIVKQEKLREINWGDAEGITPQEKEALYGKEIQTLLQTYPIRKEFWDHPVFPNAETYNALYQRLENQLIEIANAHPGQKVAIFTHGRAIKTLIGEIIDSEDCTYPVNCGIAHFIYDSENKDRPFQFVKIENYYK
ncbi:MAG TPA: histidine phosphatase family protein [Rhabdochlamydiaceae bacterium]|nr:histidine phosphatase family protein [Rhabdochlamydiaceae bacterium]